MSLSPHSVRCCVRAWLHRHDNSSLSHFSHSSPSSLHSFITSSIPSLLRLLLEASSDSSLNGISPGQFTHRCRTTFSYRSIVCFLFHTGDSWQSRKHRKTSCCAFSMGVIVFWMHLSESLANKELSNHFHVSLHLVRTVYCIYSILLRLVSALFHSSFKSSQEKCGVISNSELCLNCLDEWP